jgi:ribonuclease HII
MKSFASMPLQALTALLRTNALSAADLQELAQDSRATVRRLAAQQQKRHLLRAQRAAAEETRLASMLELETALYARGLLQIAGVDEAGAGPLAGPVFAAAVILPAGLSLPGIDDSKKLTAAARNRLAQQICEGALYHHTAQASAAEIDAINIRQACLLAMRRAVEGLPMGALSGAPGEPGALRRHVLVDAHTVPGLQYPQTGIIKGDTRSQSIAAASILAKTARDAAMCRYAEQYPGYGFEIHKGYGTALHMQRLQQLGPCPLHRRSFAPVTLYA